MTKVSIVLAVLALTLPILECRFLENGRSFAKPKEEAKKPAAKKAEVKKEGPCLDQVKLKEEIEKMEATDEKFLPKVIELKEAVAKCREEQAQAKRDAADAATEKQWTADTVASQTRAKENATLVNTKSIADPAPAAEKPKEDDGLGRFAGCRARDELKEEVDKLKVTDAVFLEKVLALRDATTKCREENAKIAREKAKAATNDRWGSFVNTSSLTSANVLHEKMNLQARQFMEVDLGPFASAAEACDYCFGSFTKQGDAPAGPVAPFCVCMAYPEGGKHNMFCATPPSAAEYIQKKNGCRCKAKDMEAMGKTTCKPI